MDKNDETLRIPDALWLICGLEDEGPQMVKVATAPWAVNSAAMPSGVALVTPRFGVGPLFLAMGVFAADGNMRSDADVLPGEESLHPEHGVVADAGAAVDSSADAAVVVGANVDVGTGSVAAADAKDTSKSEDVHGEASPILWAKS